jgi:hypothetical protein
MPRKPDLSIIGQTFNSLEVLEYTNIRNSYGRGLYRCRCKLCGSEALATRDNLVRGEIKNCGCMRHDPKNNLVGETFGRLTVLKTTVAKNRLHYICRCECGKEVICLPGDLAQGRVKSCGCLQSDNAKALYIAGTAPCKLKESSSPRSTNTSGRTGVWFDKTRGAWCAEIMFRRKKNFLGRRALKEDAIRLREQAEKELFGDFLAWYAAIKNEKN